MAVFTVFFQMLALLIMIAAGYVMAKKGMLDEHTNGKLSKMIVNVFNPMLFLSSALDSVGQISAGLMLQIGLIAAGMFVFFIAAGMALTPFFDRDPGQRKIFQLMFVFSNLGFIGIPVISSVLGPDYVVYITGFLVMYNIIFYTYGIAVMDGKFSLDSLKGMVNPGTASCAAAVAVLVLEPEVPEFIETAVTYLGNATSPLALVLVGYALACSDLRKVFGATRLYLFSAVKLLVLPLLMLPVLRMVTEDAAVLSVCMIMFGMPIGNMPLMLGNERGIDGTTSSAAIILTTVLCVFTVPLLVTAAV